MAKRKKRKRKVTKKRRKKMNNEELKDFLIHGMTNKEKNLNNIDEAIDYFEKKGKK